MADKDDDNDFDAVLETEPGALREQALLRLRKRRDFHAHLFVYFVLNTAFWALWAITGADGTPWPLWVTLFWGIGLVFNAWDVYGRKPITQEEIDREVERLGHMT